MRKKFIRLVVVVCILLVAACKKDAGTNTNTGTVAVADLKNDLTVFGVSGQLYNATLNPVNKTISVVISHLLDKKALNFVFSVSDQAKLL